jgi:hypothetical protein
VEDRLAISVGGCGDDQVEQPRPAVELGKEVCGVALRFGAVDPLQAGADGAVVAAALKQGLAAVAATDHSMHLRRPSVGGGGSTHQEHVNYLEKRANNDIDCIMTLLLTADPSQGLVIFPDKRRNISHFYQWHQ